MASPPPPALGPTEARLYPFALNQLLAADILNECGEPLALRGEPRSAPPRPRPPRRWPSITPTIPQRKPRKRHSPDDDMCRRWPRIRASHLRAPAWT